MSSTLPLVPGLDAHCSGALWIAATQTAIIADVHLGYSWAQRRRGELGPLIDAGTRDKLLRVVRDLVPARIVFLGDLVHAPRPCEAERAYIESILHELTRHTEVITVRGNHDRAFAREFSHLPVPTVASWSELNLYAIHGDALPQQLAPGVTLVMGHLHPALPIVDAAGAGRKLPVFLASAECIVLPAFSPFAGGYDLLAGLPSDIARLTTEFRAYAVTASRVTALGPLGAVVHRLLNSETGRPGEFRGFRAAGKSR